MCVAQDIIAVCRNKKLPMYKHVYLYTGKQHKRIESDGLSFLFL